MSDGEQIRDDLITMISEDPTPFQFAGVEYVGIKSGINRRRPLEVGGFEDMPELTLVVNLRDGDGGLTFGQDRPTVGKYITIATTQYRIDRTEIDSYEECLQMDLRSKSI